MSCDSAYRNQTSFSVKYHDALPHVERMTVEVHGAQDTQGYSLVFSLEEAHPSSLRSTLDDSSRPPNMSTPGGRIALPTDSPPLRNQTSPRNSSGWDGKLRIDKSAEAVNGDSEESDEDAPAVEDKRTEVVNGDPDALDENAPPVEQIAADEGGYTGGIYSSH